MTTNLLSVIEQQHKALEFAASALTVDSAGKLANPYKRMPALMAMDAALAAGKQALEQTQVEPSAHPSYATERERLEALSRICEEGHAVEKIIKDAVKRNPNAFVFKEKS